MKLTRTLIKRMRAVGFSLIKKMQKDPRTQFRDNAYYLTLDGVLISLRPHYGWKKARAAAKRINSRAFIMRGSTLNRQISNSQWEGAKRAWGMMA